MVNYNKSTIYKLCCKDTEITDEYVGSTTNFSRRKAEHKSHCHNENGSAYHFKVYECTVLAILYERKLLYCAYVCNVL